MVCLYCGSATSVINSRHQRRDNAIWRRRLCLGCLIVFTSIERAALDTTLRVQHPGHAALLQPFDRDRLFISIYESCRHRPTAMHDARNLTQQIINRLLGSLETPGLVPRAQLVTISYQTLKKFDKAAASFFAAYHPV